MPISAYQYSKMLLLGLRMTEEEALRLYLPYKRKNDKLNHEMQKENFIEHVKENRDWYIKNNFIWNVLISGEEIPIKACMPTLLVGYFQKNIFDGRNLFPKYRIKVITKNLRMLKKLNRRIGYHK